VTGSPECARSDPIRVRPHAPVLRGLLTLGLGQPSACPPRILMQPSERFPMKTPSKPAKPAKPAKKTARRFAFVSLPLLAIAISAHSQDGMVPARSPSQSPYGVLGMTQVTSSEA